SKIARLLPRTFSLCASDFLPLFADFAEKHQQRSPSSYVNAIQYYVFLRRRWLREQPRYPFLPDLAFCELALVAVARPAAQAPSDESTFASREVLMRRARGVYLRACRYDIRPLLSESKALDVERLEERALFLAMAPSSSPGRGRLLI